MMQISDANWIDLKQKLREVELALHRHDEPLARVRLDSAMRLLETVEDVQQVFRKNKLYKFQAG